MRQYNIIDLFAGVGGLSYGFSMLPQFNVIAANEIEKDIFKRGRNYKTNSSPKNTDIITYHISTGFEALIGFWYLNEEWERIELMWNIIKTKMEEANGTISIREECC